MKSSSLVLLALLSACGGGETEAPPPPAAGQNEGKPFLPPEVTTSGMQRASAQREPGKFVGEAGEFAVELTIDGKPVRFTIGLDLVALRIGDVPSLAYPIGFVKFDPLSLDSGLVDRDRMIVDLLFRTQGSPIQIVFDVHSVGDMVGRLPETGGTASGQVLGALQVDDRLHELDVSAHFERKDKDHLTLQIDPFDLPLAEVGLTPRLARLASALGVRSIGPTARVSGGLGLVTFEGPLLPTFPRTPVTINSVEEVKERLDAEIDDDESARIKLLRTGTSGVIADGITKEFLEGGEKLMNEMRNGKGGSVLGPPPRR